MKPGRFGAFRSLERLLERQFPPCVDCERMNYGRIDRIIQRGSAGSCALCDGALCTAHLLPDHLCTRCA